MPGNRMPSPASLSLLVLRSANPAASVQFYSALGLQFAREQHATGPEHWAAELPGLVLEIYPLGSQSPTTGLRLGFTVASIAAAVENACQAGGRVIKSLEEIEDGWHAVLADPDGHRIMLSQSR